MIKLEFIVVVLVIDFIIVVFPIVNVVFISSIQQQTHSKTVTLLLLPSIVIVIAFTLITFSIPIIV